MKYAQSAHQNHMANPNRFTPDNDLDPYYRKKDYAEYLGALLICMIGLVMVMCQLNMEEAIARAKFMAHCEMCHPPTPEPILKTLNDFKVFHQKKKAVKAARLNDRMAKEIWLAKELVSQ